MMIDGQAGNMGAVGWRAFAGLAAVIVLLVTACGPMPGSPPTWTIVASPTPTTTENSQLDGVAAISATDVWAVGFFTVNTTPRTLAEHWTGSSWSIVTSPNVKPGTASNVLVGVAPISPTDVWTVGNFALPPNDIQRTLTVRYS